MCLEDFNKRRSALEHVRRRDLPGFHSVFVTIGNWGGFFPSLALRWGAAASDSSVASVFYFIRRRLMLFTGRICLIMNGRSRAAEQLTMAPQKVQENRLEML